MAAKPTVPAAAIGAAIHNCYDCLSPMREIVGTYIFSECGVENVVLLNQTLLRCDRCAAESPVIFAISDLHNCIAKALWRKRNLSAAEKKYLGKIEQPFIMTRYWTYRRHGQLIECSLSKRDPQPVEVVPHAE